MSGGSVEISLLVLPRTTSNRIPSIENITVIRIILFSSLFSFHVNTRGNVHTDRFKALSLSITTGEKEKTRFELTFTSSNLYIYGFIEEYKILLDNKYNQKVSTGMILKIFFCLQKSNAGDETHAWLLCIKNDVFSW